MSQPFLSFFFNLVLFTALHFSLVSFQKSEYLLVAFFPFLIHDVCDFSSECRVHVCLDASASIITSVHLSCKSRKTRRSELIISAVASSTDTVCSVVSNKWSPRGDIVLLTAVLQSQEQTLNLNSGDVYNHFSSLKATTGSCAEVRKDCCHSLHNCFCHFSCKQSSATLWMSSRRDCLKMCPAFKYQTNHIFSSPLRLGLWSFGTTVNTFDFRRSQYFFSSTQALYLVINLIQSLIRNESVVWGGSVMFAC